MFRVRGAAGQAIRIDLKASDTIKHRWSRINPVYAAAEDLDDPALYQPTAAPIGRPKMAWNGARLPPDDLQKWHFIADCWMPNDTTFCMVQRFVAGSVTVAMRVPYLPGYSSTALRNAAAVPGAIVNEAGLSQKGRPLNIVNIADDPADTQRPCVLIYAGEHADEQDAMWVAHGAVQYLLGPTPAAADLRHRFRFLVIPQLDPDSAAVSRHNGIVISFMTDREVQESRAYANWFQHWIEAGNRIDMVLDLHNMQGQEMPTHISCAWLEGVGARGNLCAAMHAQLMQDADASSLKFDKTFSQRAWSPDRLGGWLSRRYGPIGFLYEVNAQQEERHLSLEELQSLGGLFVRSTAAFIDGPNGLPLRREVNRRLAERAGRWAKAKSQVPPGSSAIVAEAIVSRGVGLAAKGTPAEKWVP